MILCLDAGNSRLKWGLAEPAGWLAQGALDWDDAQMLSALVAGWPPLTRVVLSSVACEAREALLAQAFPGQVLEHMVSTSAAAGVVNGYLQPRQLGVDRWCALIGARSLSQQPCLVVTAGTATTIDSLDGEGRFLGGLILPGLEMMHTALAQGTARLPRAPGAYQDFPRQTQDAIRTGCLEAQLGAIERAYARLPGAALCFLSGGAAPALERQLELPLLRVDNLVLEGLRLLALNGSAP